MLYYLSRSAQQVLTNKHTCYYIPIVNDALQFGLIDSSSRKNCTNVTSVWATFASRSAATCELTVPLPILYVTPAHLKPLLVSLNIEFDTSQYGSLLYPRKTRSPVGGFVTKYSLTSLISTNPFTPLPNRTWGGGRGKWWTGRWLSRSLLGPRQNVAVDELTNGQLVNLN